MSKTQPDALAEAFAELPKPERLCPIGRLLRSASTDARRNIEAALTADQRDVPNRWIVERLQAAGVVTSKDTVSDHRKSVCRCYPS